jgi:MobA/MobL family
MAIFHMSAKTVSRGKGQSAIAKAAYNARDQIRDERTGKLKSYARFSGVVYSEIFAPKDAPAWTRDRQTLWNEVERAEKRKDAQLSREITLGLPHELTADQRRQLVTDFIREQFTRQGMIADVNIHVPGGKGDDRNHHAHVLLTMREIGPEGFGPKVREWNSREQLEKWREGWERTQNRYLERHGHEARVDRRTLEAQGIDREPTTHLGPQAFAMEQRKGIETERGAIYRDSSFTSQQETAKLKLELAAITRQIAALEDAATVMRPEPRETRAGGRTDDQPTAANDNRPEIVTLVSPKRSQDAADRERLAALGFDDAKAEVLAKWRELGDKVDGGRITEKDRLREMSLYVWREADKERRAAPKQEQIPDHRSREADRER